MGVERTRMWRAYLAGVSVGFVRERAVELSGMRALRARLRAVNAADAR